MSVPNPTSQRTPAQTIFIHTAESVGLSALLTIVVAALQYISLHGYNLAGLETVLGSSFVAQMAMVYKSLNNPNTIQAAADTEQQLAPALLQPATAPVIINHNYPPASSVPDIPPVQPLQATPDMATKPMPAAKTQPKAG